ncbi:MAG: hypothetical protein ACRC2V_13975, partial [Xenococcaceae cyanobacterium]
MISEPLKLPIEHFDTLTKKHLNITETFKNTIAQYLFPNVKFSLGSVYEQSTKEQLENIEGKSLQFANG